MFTVGIDCGKWHSAYAVLDDGGQLVAAGKVGQRRAPHKDAGTEEVAALVATAAKLIRAHLPDRPCAVVVERPQVYAHRGAKGADALLDIWLTGGSLALRLCEMLPGSTLRGVRPSEWKGQIPKPPSGRLIDYAIFARLVTQLGDAEMQRLTQALASTPADLQMDVADAVGIARWGAVTPMRRAA